MESDYVSAYARLESDHWWWRARARIVLAEIDRVRPPSGWQRALDAGCGAGSFLDAIEERAEHAEGLEPEPGLADTAAARSAGRVVHRTPLESFVAEDRYDLVTFMDVLEHIADPGAALGALRRVANENGTLLITVPAMPMLWTSHDVLNDHYRRYTARGLAADVTAAGFEVVSVRHFFHWATAAKLAQRASERVRSREPRSPGIPPGPLNTALEWLSRADAVVGGLLGLPFGSSLLLLARRAPD